MKRFAWVGVALLSVGAAALYWRTRPDSITVFTDADRIREPVETAQLREILWQPPTRLPDEINIATSEDYEPRLAPDGLTLYFVRGKAGGSADVYVSRRTHAGWQPAEPLDVLNSPADELGPEPSADGLSLYFYSDRPGGMGGYDLWVSYWGDDGWQSPVSLGPRVNSTFNDYGPALSPDGRTLYFASNRPLPDDVRQPDPAAWSATLREDFFHRPYDLYASAVTDDGIAAPLPIDSLNTREHSEGAPAVSPFGDFLYFSSNRPGGLGGFDLYRSRLRHGVAQAIENLGPSINTAVNELDPATGMGGFALFFSSNRPSGAQSRARTTEAPAPAPAYAVYHTVSREVFRQTEERHNPIDWAGVFRQLLPNLLWAALALLLLLLLLSLMRDTENRKLSLLTKCLLASMGLHLLLLLLLNFWQVGAMVASAIRGGATKVIIASAAPANDIGAQFAMAPSEIPAQPIETTEVAVPPLQAPVPTLEHIAVDAIVSQPEAQPLVQTVALVMATPPQSPQVDQSPQWPDVTPTDTQSMPLATPAAETPDASAEAVAELSIDVEMSRLESSPRGLTPSTQPFQPDIAARIDPVAADNRTSATEAPSVASTAVPAESVVRPSEATIPADAESVPAQIDQSIALAVPADQGQAERVNEQEPTTRLTAQAIGVQPPPPRDLVADTRPASPQARIDPAVASAKRDVGSLAEPAGDVPVGANPAPTSAPQSVAQAQAPFNPLTGMELRLPQSTTATDIQDAEPDAPAPRVSVPPAVTSAPPTGLLADDAARQQPPQLAELAPVAGGPRVSTLHQDSLASGPLTPVDPKPTATADRGHQPPKPAAFGLDVDDLPPLHDPPTLGLRVPVETRKRLDPFSAVGGFAGVVSDARTGRPLVHAIVRLNLPQRPLVASTDDEGRYHIEASAAPSFVALTAQAEGYVPRSHNVSTESFNTETIIRNFSLSPVSREVVSLESAPQVHHLGNDRFEGAINSQFQRESEGEAIIFEFSLTRQQLALARRPEIRVLTKGVQCRHVILFNDDELVQRLSRSPSDGSFGECRIPLDRELLRRGRNTLQISTGDCTGDVDDFEFVNVRILMRGSNAAEP